MNGNKILVTGCSFTKGFGLKDEEKNPALWCNQMFPDSEIVNLSLTGADNNWIFMNTMEELFEDNYDLVIVQWSAVPRFNLQFGLERWDTSSKLNLIDNYDIGLHTGDTITRDWLTDLGKRLRRYHNDHWSLLELVRYVNILSSMKENIFFVNGLLPFSQNFFTRKNFVLPSELTAYEQELLDVENRDDEEVHELYNMIHDQYEKHGGIQEHKWLNLYDSMLSTKIDTIAEDDPHPGLDSQRQFAQAFTRKINDGINN